MRIAGYIIAILAVLAGGLFAGSLWLTSVPSVSAAERDMAQSLDAWFEDRHTQTLSQFNGAALVIRDGEVIVRGAWGKDGEGRTLTADSQFRLASVSKSFTAAAILKLADDGLLDLDAPVADQIEQCPIEATPAQLMQHTSGIADDYFEKADPDEITTVAWVFDHVCATKSGSQAPAEFAYNNTVYVFLAGLVERVSGQSFENYLAAELLEPLGLENTRVWNLVSEDEFESRATSFGRDGPLNPTNLDGVAGDGAVFSTVDDLANWARFWRDDRLLSSALKDRATGRGTGEGAGDGYHFGLNRNGNRISHNGGWLGARTYLGFNDNGAGGDVVILLDNGSSMYVDDLVAEVWQALD